MKTSKPISIGDLVGHLGKRAPFDYAEDWDNVGFLAGDAAEKCTGAVVAVNLGPEALAAAKASGANAIICHHPPIFKPVSKVTRAAQPYLYEAVRSGYNVVALHTNFDLASEEMCQGLAARLGFKYSGFLTGRGGGERPRSLRLGKFITYLPEKDLDAVREAVSKAGAGRIGNYEQCSFSWPGEGTFRGNEKSNPSIGQAGRLEKVAERRFEVVFPWKSLEQVIRAARSAASYEELAYDIIELEQPAHSIGYGFVGQDESGSLTFPKFVESVKQAFKLSSVTVVGSALTNPKMRVEKMAFSPGSGSSFVNAAAAIGADVYVCGEVGYHQMLEARQKGITLVILGHSYSERFFVETAAGWCESIVSPAPVEKVFETIHETV
jgi:dinuclear metal center YbgI/SA1388 family protein